MARITRTTPDPQMGVIVIIVLTWAVCTIVGLVRVFA